jgi:2-aminomuconate deaminase
MITNRTKNGHAIIVDDRAAALARYPHARVVGDLIFVSGISSRRSDNSHEGVTLHGDGRVDKDIGAQTRAVIKNIEAILAAAGARLENVVDITVFLVDMADYGGMNAVWNEFFIDKLTAPARTTVAVHQLPHPNLLVEMKATALLPSSSSTSSSSSSSSS